MDIIIDTKGQSDLRDKIKLIESEDEEEYNVAEEFINNEAKIVGTLAMEFLKEIEKKEIERKENQKKKNLSRNYIDLDEFEKDMGWRNVPEDDDANVDEDYVPQDITDVIKLTNEITPIDEILKKSVIKPGFEKLKSIPSLRESKRRAQAKKIAERNKTKGTGWYNLPATEVTDEIKHDLEVIQMRSVLDPKHFYKKNDLKVLPKYFQIGKVIDSPIDYYSDRLTKKERKNTIVEELMADAEFNKYNKRKYKEIIDEKSKKRYKAYRHAKRLKTGKKK